MKQLTSHPDSTSYKLVNFGIDTLVLNIRYADKNGNPAPAELTEDQIAQLDEWQNEARKEEQPIVVPRSFHKVSLLMHPHGAGKGRWRWLLTCKDHLNLMISRGRMNGIIAQVRLSSALLWSSEDPVTHHQKIWPLLQEFEQWLTNLFRGEDRDRLHLQVSEVHLCADIVGWDVEHCYDWQATMLSRARRRRPLGSYVPPEPETDCRKHHCPAGSFLWEGPDDEIPNPIYNGHRLETIEFGSHGSPLSCSIYNKLTEIRKSNKLWFRDIWRLRGWNGTSPVWRVEFRWHREALHEIKQNGVFHGIETIADLKVNLSHLWTYAAGHTQTAEYPDGWLRYVVPTADSTPTRWPIHPAWAVVQSAHQTRLEPAVDTTTGEVLTLPASDLAVLIRERHRQGDIIRLLQQIAGCASALAAHLGGRKEDNITDLVAALASVGETLPEHKPDMDITEVLAWVADHAAIFACKTKLPPGAPADVVQGTYDTEFSEAVTQKRVLYGLQSHNS